MSLEVKLFCTISVHESNIDRSVTEAADFVFIRI